MRKAVARYLVVLLVAGLLALAVYSLVQRNAASLGSNLPARPGEFTYSENGSTASQAGVTEGTRPQGFEGHAPGDEGEMGGLIGGLLGLAGILKNLVVITIVTLVVSLVPKGMRKLQPASPSHS